MMIKYLGSPTGTRLTHGRVKLYSFKCEKKGSTEERREAEMRKKKRTKKSQGEAQIPGIPGPWDNYEIFQLFVRWI